MTTRDPDTLEEAAAAEEFFRTLSKALPASLPHLDPELTPGHKVSQYEILERIGAGGMGTVYRAHDSRLDRAVALKFLPAHLSTLPDARERLFVEARAAAALEHSNVCAIHEIGQTEDGRPFIAMSLCEGESLQERLREGPIPVAEAVQVAAQIARGLAAAHQRGIVHRDVKPGNIIIASDGIVKIVDFGLARMADATVAYSGVTPGTIAYMSPEQARGEPVDHHTDLWSLGVVLYEMLTVVRPFRGGNDRTLIQAILHEEPVPVSQLRPETPRWLAGVVERLLCKDPADRYGSAEELLDDLAHAGMSGVRLRIADLGSTISLVEWWNALSSARRFGIGAAIVVLLLVGSAGLYGLVSSRKNFPNPGVAGGEAALPAVAVLPFEVKGPGLDIWREGMVDLLSANLDGVAGLRAIGSRTVLARWRERALDAEPDLEKALEVARGTGAGYAVIGNVVSSGSRMRLGAQILRLEDQRSLASLHVEGPPDSLFALVDRLSIDVLAAIWQGRQSPSQQVDLTRITTSSLPALKAFLEGERLLRGSDFEGAVAAYERAVAADSAFAFAQYHLGLAHGWIGNEDEQNQAYQKALQHADRLPGRESLLLRAVVESYTNAFDIPTWIGFFQEATRKYPDDPDAWYQLGDRYWHNGRLVLLPSREESEKAFRKVVELDPGFAPAYVHLVNNAFVHRPDSARAARLIELYHGLAPNSSSDQESRIAFGLAFGDSGHRQQALSILDTLPPESRLAVAIEYLNHPRFGTQRGAVLEHVSRRDLWPGRSMTAHLFEHSLSQGRVQAALTYLEDPLMLPAYRVAGLYRIHAAGLRGQGLSLDQPPAPPRANRTPPPIDVIIMTFYAGAYAADQGRWEDHAAAAARLRSQANGLQAEGNSPAAGLARGAVVALEGQGAWRRGDAERALGLLVEGQRRTRSETLNATIRWWLGELLLEMDRPQEAARYFETFWNDPLAVDRLAPIYEQQGDRATARDAYALVALGWKDADPELQPRVRAARAAVQRLTRTASP